MNPIICSNNAKSILHSIREYLSDDKIIKDILLMEQNDSQVVFLVDKNQIDQESAKIWWSGYSEGLKVALET